MDKIIENGYEAYVVGGYVRDYLLGIESTDVDICTNAPINEIISMFKGEGTAYPQYYALHINRGGVSYDITSYRKELSYRRNKPIEIVPAKDLAEDLLRRDFTINTFAISHEGRLVDIYGAKKDLDSRIVRVVGDTEKKFREDKTRIIRAIRFACTLDFDLDPEIIDFLNNKNVYLLNEISPEFKKKELDKIFDSTNSYKFFYLVNRYKMWKYFNIEEFSGNIIQTYNRYGIWAQINANLPFSKREKKIIESIRGIVDKGDIAVLDFALYDENVIYNAASILGMEKKVKALLEILSMHSSLIDMDISVGAMLSYVNVEDFKRVYKSVERNIMEGKLENSKEAIVDYLKCL